MSQSSEQNAIWTRSRCRFVIALMGSILLVVELAFCLGYGIVKRSPGLIVLTCILLVVVTFSSISLFGGPAVWKCMYWLNVLHFLGISLLFTMSLTAIASIWVTKQRLPMHNSTESQTRDEDIRFLTLLIPLVIIEYILFLVVFIPLFYLYTKTPPPKSQLPPVPTERTPLTASVPPKA